ncbi:MAG: sensor histidine kinase [Desulfopila sp.]
MFSVRGRGFPGPQLKYAGLFVGILTVLLLFLGGVYFLARQGLMTYCREDVARRLDMYIQERPADAVWSPQYIHRGHGLHGLGFIRVTSDDGQLFFSEKGGAAIDFEKIINIGPDLSATWVALDGGERHGSWTLQARAMRSSLQVQAGMQHPQVVELYSDLRRMIMTMGGAALAVAGGLTFYCRRKSLHSIKQAEHALTAIAAGEDDRLGEENSELRPLYVLLDKLLMQNRQLVREMQESLDNVAHDLRTPMTRLRSVAEYGLRKDDPEKLAEALSDCLEESDRVLSMLNIMMSVAEAESGTMRLILEQVELSSTIKDVVNLYEYVAEEKNIEVRVDVKSDILLTVDKTRIRQVWANLLDNAIKYCQSGGSVEIAGRSEPEAHVVVFTDNGMGISAHEIDRIWGRLFRGDRSRSEQGLGLGLNYVRAVVEAHGGEVRVHSRLHEGARFEVRLPV